LLGRFAGRDFCSRGPRLARLRFFVAAFEVEPYAAAARAVAFVGRFALEGEGEFESSTKGI